MKIVLSSFIYLTSVRNWLTFHHASVMTSCKKRTP